MPSYIMTYRMRRTQCSKPIPARTDLEARRYAASFPSAVRVETDAGRVVWRNADVPPIAPEPPRRAMANPNFIGDFGDYLDRRKT